MAVEGVLIDLCAIHNDSQLGTRVSGYSNLFFIFFYFLFKPQSGLGVLLSDFGLYIEIDFQSNKLKFL